MSNLAVRFTNLDWTKGGDDDLLRLAWAAGVAVLLGCEGRDRGNDPVPVAAYLDDPDALVFQHEQQPGESDAEAAAKAGSFVVLRRSAFPAGTTFHDRGLVLISEGGGGVQARYLRDVEVRVPGQRARHYLAGHLSLKKTGKHAAGKQSVLEHIAAIRAAGHDFVLGADVNERPLAFATAARCGFKGQKRWGIFYSLRLTASPLDVVRSVIDARLTDTPLLTTTVGPGASTAPRRPRARRPGRPARPRRRRRPGAARPRAHRPRRPGRPRLRRPSRPARPRR